MGVTSFLNIMKIAQPLGLGSSPSGQRQICKSLQTSELNVSVPVSMLHFFSSRRGQPKYVPQGWQWCNFPPSISVKEAQGGLFHLSPAIFAPSASHKPLISWNQTPFTYFYLGLILPISKQIRKAKKALITVDTVSAFPCFLAQNIAEFFLSIKLHDSSRHSQFRCSSEPLIYALRPKGQCWLD